MQGCFREEVNENDKGRVEKFEVIEEVVEKRGEEKEAGGEDWKAEKRVEAGVAGRFCVPRSRGRDCTTSGAVCRFFAVEKKKSVLWAEQKTLGSSLF